VIRFLHSKQWLGLAWIARGVGYWLIIIYLVGTRNLSGLFYEDCSALYVNTVRDYLDLVILLESNTPNSLRIKL